MISATRTGESERCCSGGSCACSATASAVRLTYLDELAKMNMKFVLYREALERAGIEPPDDSGKDLLQMWRDARAVIRAAQECVANLGTSKELLGETWK